VAVGKKIEGIDGDAMPAYAYAWCIRHVSEWLCRGSLADFIRIDAVWDTGVCHFVGVGDADHSLAVLVELHHLSYFWLRNGDDRVEDSGVHSVDGIEGAWGDVVQA
jgi:hypothetical protein